MSAPQVPRPRRRLTGGYESSGRDVSELSQPPRRRLTQAEWDAELARAKDVQAKDFERHIVGRSAPLRTRTDRRRSWWQRGWKR